MSKEVGYEDTDAIHIALDIMNHNHKGVTFVSLEDSPSTTTMLRDRIAELPGIRVPIAKNDIHKYMKNVIGSPEMGLVEKTKVAGIRRNTTATAWSLTDRGWWLQPAVAYGVTYLPVRFGLSAYEVIGPMISTEGKRGSYARVDILRSLFRNGTQTMAELSSLTGLPILKTQYKLTDLESVGSGNVEYSECLPFVEAVDGDKNLTEFVYVSLGKVFDPGDFAPKPSMISNLARRFSDAPEGSYFRATELLKDSGHSSTDTLHISLRTLDGKGYLDKKRARDFRSYRLTSAGREFVSDCLEPVCGYVSGDSDYEDYVLGNQPSIDSLGKTAGIVPVFNSMARK